MSDDEKEPPEPPNLEGSDIVAPFGTDESLQRAGTRPRANPFGLHSRTKGEKLGFTPPTGEGKDNHGRRRFPPRRSYEPYGACPKCGWDLAARTRKRAFRVLGSAGETFAREIKENYIAAIENFLSTIGRYLDILVDSRAVKADSTMKVLMEVSMALHAPKVGSRDERDPVDTIREFLNRAEDSVEEGTEEMDGPA